MSKEKIIEVFKNSEAPLKSGDLAALSGLDKKEVSKIVKELKTEGLIESPKRCYYQLKRD